MHRRFTRPLLLVQPTRAAVLSRGPARVVLAVVVAVVLGLLLLAGDVVAPDLTERLVLDDTLVERLRHGGTFYALVADSLRSAGVALRPALFFPVPTLPVIAAAVPAMVVVAMLWVLAAAAVATWQMRLAPIMAGRAGRAVTLVLLIAGAGAAVRIDLAVMPEVWSGLFIALSLAIRRQGRWIEAAALGLAAALLHPAAALYLVVMAVMASRDGERREAGGWAIAATLLVPVLAFHGFAAALVVGPLDAAAAAWSTPIGPLAALAGIGAVTHAALLPTGVTVAAAVLAIIGWGVWADPLARRAGTTLVAFVMLLVVGGNAATALLVAPIALVGLVFVPDAMRELLATALDRRRITVTRLVR